MRIRELREAKTTQATGLKFKDVIEQARKNYESPVKYMVKSLGYSKEDAQKFLLSKAPGPDMASVCKNLELQMTVRVGPKGYDFPDLRFHFHSKTRLVVEIFDTLLPQAFYANFGENLLSTGAATIQDLAEFLQANGAREKKKPKPYKSSPPLYDSKLNESAEIDAITKKMDDFMRQHGVKGGLAEISPKSRRVAKMPEFIRLEDERTALMRKDLKTECAGVGIITKQNTTPDVKPGETRRQAAKFGIKLDTANRPPMAKANGKK